MEGGRISSLNVDVGDRSYTNPNPIVWEESDSIINEHLSEVKLKEITQSNDLSNVKILEMVVNTSETSLGNFGQYVPNLIQLKLSNSIIPSVRDLGTSLRMIQVIWLSRCSLKDVDGIASLQGLKELYVSYNHIQDASPISFLDSLEVLDLEANKISDVEQIQYLCMMTQLNTLTLTGNQVTQLPKEDFDGSTYREYILSRLPDLLMLDDCSRTSEVAPMSEILIKDDVDIITEAIKEGLIEESEASVITKGDEESLGFSGDIIPSSFFETSSVKRPGTARRPKRSELPATGSLVLESSSYQDDSSSLTFGDPHCGNPINLLRNRKKNRRFDISDDELALTPGMLVRPTTALGIKSEVDFTVFADESVSDTSLTNTFLKEPPKEGNAISDDKILFTDIASTSSKSPDNGNCDENDDDFDARHPPEFLKRLQPNRSPKNLATKAPPPRTSKLKPSHLVDQQHFDQQNTMMMQPTLSAGSYSSTHLPRLVPSPPAQRPRTSGGGLNRRRWNLADSNNLSRPQNLLTLPSKFLNRKEVKKKFPMSDENRLIR